MAGNEQEPKPVKTDDASGRGAAQDFKVPCRAPMRPYTEPEIDVVVEVMRCDKSQTQGEYQRQFQAEFAEYTGANHAFAVDNCTNALRLAAICCELEPGDEVIIPAYTFCASAIAFGATGARIVWADTQPETWNIDPADIERKITDRTRAIVAVHLLGMPADMPAVMDIAEEYGLRVVEDCAQAAGAQINGQHVGTFGDFGCFSFHTAKNITTLGEGGVLTCKYDKDAELIPGLRCYGSHLYPEGRERYWEPAMSNVDLDIPGVWPKNFSLGEAQCALGSKLLKSLEEINDTLIEQADRVKAALADTPEISFARIPEGYRHVFCNFVMHFDGSAFGAGRNDLMDIMAFEHKIQVVVQYYPLYRYPLFQKLGAGDYDCPVLEGWWDDTFSFPWWCGMSDETIDYACSSLNSTIATLKGE